jgi:hypothetical protein
MGSLSENNNTIEQKELSIYLTTQNSLKASWIIMIVNNKIS